MASTEPDRRRALDRLFDEVRSCTRCRLHEGRTLAVPGEGPLDARVLLIGEAPGREEDGVGRPFVGAAGRILDEALSAARLSRDSMFLTNVVKCRPPKNRRPKADEIGACRAYLLRQIAEVRPTILVTLGATGLASLLGEGIELRAARTKVHEFGGLPLVATYHPAAVLYNRKLERDLRKDLKRVARFLRTAPSRVRSEPPRTGAPFQTAISSGGVLARPDGRVLLLRRVDEDIWCLPKGTVEAGESLEAAAVREIQEETGLDVKLLRPLMTIHYAYYWPPSGRNVDKTVAYFLAEAVSGRVAPEAGFEEARWATRAEAMRLLYWKNDRDVVARAFEILRRSAD